MNNFNFNPIGTIHSPHVDHAPYQPVEDDSRKYCIEIFKEYTAGLEELATFHYIYVLFLLDRVSKPLEMTVEPPWAADGKQVGLFASRSPVRPNPIGLSVVRVRRIEDNRIYVSGLDALNGTPVLDIKPYIQELDIKPDANNGWLEGQEARDHLAMHIQGLSHRHDSD